MTRLEFELLGNKPLVPVRVDGRGPYAFLLDNGSSYDVVDTAVAHELALEVVPFEEQRGAGEGTSTAGRPTTWRSRSAAPEHLPVASS